MKGVLSMKTNMQEINEPAFHAYLKKAQSSPNTIRSCWLPTDFIIPCTMTWQSIICSALRTILSGTTKHPQ